VSDSTLLAGIAPSFTLRVRTRTTFSRIVLLGNKSLGAPASAAHWRRRFPGHARPRAAPQELGSNRDLKQLNVSSLARIAKGLGVPVWELLREAGLDQAAGHPEIPSRAFAVHHQNVEWDRLWWAISVAAETTPAIVGILDAINRSRTILSLADDWDGEGAVGYSTATWERATLFLLRQAKLAADQFHVALEVPGISPADQGSIDLFWRAQDRRLLVNFPADEGAPATYYGENRKGDTISGHINTESARADLIAWLATTF